MTAWLLNKFGCERVGWCAAPLEASLQLLGHLLLERLLLEVELRNHHGLPMLIPKVFRV
jgi:hypothetical protein